MCVKKKIAGFTNVFICPECKVIYCDNCARTLTLLENMCWACNTQIDKSKKVKPYKKEEDLTVEFSEGAPKKIKDDDTQP